MTRDPVVKLDDVDVTFSVSQGWRRTPVRAVEAVSLQIAAGETLGLVGESGSGKSTTGMVSLGMQRPTAGTVLFRGRPLPRRRRRLGGAMQAVLQNPQASLDPRIRVRSSVAEPLDIVGTHNREEKAEAVEASLAEVGLNASFANRYPHELSGGQMQRVAIARALITRPSYIVFDESVSALDVSVQAQILNLIKQLQAEHEFAAMFITHDLDVVRYVAHTICVMHEGRIVESAASEELFERPRHDYTRSLLGGNR
jgi:ABC-type oligopeptide transport system ATPase subunit